MRKSVCHVVVSAVAILCAAAVASDALAQQSSDAAFGAPGYPSGAPATAAPPIEVERGKPRPIVDGIGWLLGIPEKLLLWDGRAKNHDVSEATEAKTVEYLATSGVTGTKVRVNQYAPFDEWRRLTQNKRVGAGWRYTMGGLYTIGYTLFPGRLFGNDSYNPYTDTINLYSDIPALAMEQAAYTTDVLSRDRPGTYATVQSLPFVGLWHERNNKQDVFAHLESYGTPEQQKEARRILYPQFGMEVGGEIGSIIPPAQTAVQLTGAVVGHAFGRHQAKRIDAEVESADFPRYETTDTSEGPVFDAPVVE